MRRRAKVDRNQPAITAALRAAGWAVKPLHMVGQGFPDLLAGKGGVNALVEIKMPGEKLTPDEVEFHATWPGPVIIAYDEQDAIEKAEALR
jgi:Holliday junction resolvase